LCSGRSAIGPLAGAEEISGLNTRVAGVVPALDARRIPRKDRRSMSRMSQFAWLAAQEALAQAAIGPDLLSGGRLGLSVGSTVGSVDAIEGFFSEYLRERSLEQIRSTTFFKVMGHSVASNLAQALGIGGRVLAPAAACSTGSQAVGLAWESVAWGRQEIMLCGGADELSALTAATFDIMNAASSGANDRPEAASRPFDAARDGIVCAEGAGILVLESLEHALRRQTPILAEIVGFASNASPANIVHPDTDSILACMGLALADAGLEAGAIDYINAHATGTVAGDVAEGRAIEALCGHRLPISSLKGHMGHTMAASGALELIASLRMMGEGRVLPTLNLETPDPACGHLDLPRVQRPVTINAFMKNSFALGGVNAVLVVRSYP
jgi:3-oxoacyl-[acyl-carrier-protein] synthase II